MPDANLTKKLYCDALLSLCESRKLSDVTVTALVAQAGTARQTFYNHFNDVNDLIGYLTTNILETYVRPAYFAETVFEAYSFAVEHKGFFCQLPFHEGQNNFRETFISFMRELLREEFIDEDMAEAETLYRIIAIDQAIIGVTDTFLEWCRNRMQWPIEMLVRVQYDSTPGFIRESQVLPPRLCRALDGAQLPKRG